MKTRQISARQLTRVIREAADAQELPDDLEMIIDKCVDDISSLWLADFDADDPVMNPDPEDLVPGDVNARGQSSWNKQVDTATSKLRDELMNVALNVRDELHQAEFYDLRG